MKRRLKIVTLFLTAVAMLVLAGCKKDNNSDDLIGNIQPPLEKSQNQEPNEFTEDETLEINYTQTGVALNWDSATESYTDTWRLLYDEAGNPAANKELVFNDSSICVIDGAKLGCTQAIADKKLTNGATVKIEGNSTGNKVTVVKLTLIEKGE